jgi:hypothetical protein
MAKSLSQSPFRLWVEEAEFNKAAIISPAEYKKCWHASLARMAVTLNHAIDPRKFSVQTLAKDDDSLLTYARRASTKDALYVMEVVFLDSDQLRGNAIRKDDVAENFFYGNLDFRNLSKYVGIVAKVPQAFLDYSYKGLHAPARHGSEIYTPTELGTKANESPSKIMSECAANYLLRNFWHNYVHVMYQNINGSNFMEFPGNMRNDSDFEADNLSHLLLAHSYGLPVLADRISDSLPIKSILHLLRRNRCNDLFRLRAKNVSEQMSVDEQEFRICRTVSGYLSGWLLAQGLAVTSLSVHFIGLIEGKNSPRRPRDKGFAVSLNGVRFAYKNPWPEGKESPEREQYLRDLSTWVTGNYVQKLRADKSLLRYAVHSLDAVFKRGRILPH